MASRNKKKRHRKLPITNGVPFASGFQRPTERQSERAVGLGEDEKCCREYQIGEEYGFFQSVPCPTSIDDWLAQYNEEGQHYKSFLSTCPWLSSRKRKYMSQKFIPEGRNIKEKYPEGKIFLQPLGDFEGEASPNIIELAKYAELFYSIPVEVLPMVHLDLPREKDGPVCWYGFEDKKTDKNDTEFTNRRKSSRIASKSREFEHRWHNGKIQLRVQSILNTLREQIPPTALCLIGLTMVDLYEESPDLFVAGMAAGNHKVAVFSFARYDPSLSFSKEFWYDIQHIQEYKPEEKKSIMLQRSCKLLVHEIAHLFGVDHCIWYSCCMNGSGHLDEDFAQPIYLCPVDLHKLQRLCGFDIVQRYKNLLSFFRKHGMEQEGNWIEHRIHFITEKDS